MSTGKIPLLYAHRGSSVQAPENTLTAFQIAHDDGIDGIELDVHLCGSGEVVVIHDFTLKRTATLDAIVEKTPYRVIAGLDAGSWFGPQYAGERIPLLEEVIEQFGDRIRYDIEIKRFGLRPHPLEAKVLEIIERNGVRDNCTVSSFNPFAIRGVNRISPEIKTAVIFSTSKQMPFFLRKGQGRLLTKCSILKPHSSQVSTSFVSLFTGNRGYRLMPWTVDDLDEACRLSRLGVYAIVSNDPVSVRTRILNSDCSPDAG